MPANDFAANVLYVIDSISKLFPKVFPSFGIVINDLIAFGQNRVLMFHHEINTA